MSDQRNQIYGFYQLRIISAENPPQCSKLYVKMSLAGPIKAYLDKTGFASHKKCEWKTGWFYFNPIRGTRVYFDLYNDDVGVDKLYATGNFDPKTMKMSQNGEIIQIPLTHLTGKYSNSNSPTILNVVIQYMPRDIPSIAAPSSSTSSPLYISVDSNVRITQNNLNQFYRFPFELSAVVFNDSSNVCRCVNSAYREVQGLYHSGPHTPGSYSSFSPVLRIDPKALQKIGKYVYIILSTTNYTPLKKILNPNNSPVDANVTVWKTDEPSGEYNRAEDFKLREKGNKMEPFGQFQVIADAQACHVVVAYGYIKEGNLELVPSNFSVPNDECPSFQDPSEIIGNILTSISYARIPPPYAPSNLSIANGVPVYLPRSLCSMFKIGFEPKVTAIVGSLKKHNFSVTCLNFDLKPILSCGKSNSNIANNNINYVSGNITANLGSLPSEICYLVFNIYGGDTLAKELSKDNDKTNESLYLKVLVNQFEVIKAPSKYSKTKRGMVWFILYKDPFGGWTILNLRHAVQGSTENDCINEGVKAIRSILL